MKQETETSEGRYLHQRRKKWKIEVVDKDHLQISKDQQESLKVEKEE